MNFTRRRRLILQYGIISLIPILAVSFFLFRALQKKNPYIPGKKIEGITNELDRRVPIQHPDVVFAEVSTPARLIFRHFPGIRSTQLPEDMGSGAAWGDYDNDGDPDLYLCNIAAPLTATQKELTESSGGNRLFRNKGDGTFEDVTASANLNWNAISMAAAWADYNNDGFLDLIVTAYGANKLYRNNRNGTFTDVSSSSGIAADQGFWTDASWADYDRDGDMDVYICGYVKYVFHPEERNRTSRQYAAVIPFTLNPSSYDAERNLLYRNNGDGTFTNVARSAGVENPEGRSLSAAWCDFNKDGNPDLYVANDISDNAMLMNTGNGKFKDVSESSWVADYRGAMGLGIGDWDNDGDMDIFITHWIAQENALFDNFFVADVQKHNGFVGFTDIADRVGLGQIALDYIGWGTSFIDYDNDGRRDLLVVNGSTFQEEKNPRNLIPMRNLLFWNHGKEGFVEVGKVSGQVFSRPLVGRGAAFADYDQDGDLDAVILNHGAQVSLLRNDGGNRNNWIQVDARNVSGDPAIGAKVEIISGELKEIDEIGAQPSYLSQNEPVAHFGLGQHKTVDSIKVVFPRGKVVELTGIHSNQRVRVNEH